MPTVQTQQGNGFEQDVLVYSLAEVQATKNAELYTEMQTALLTFKSNALGTVNTYNSAPNDLTMLNGEYTFVTGPDFVAGSNILWYTLEQGWIPHTSTQFRQVFNDCRNNTQMCYGTLAELNAQVAAATTIDQVNSISW